MRLFLFHWPHDTSAFLDALVAFEKAGHEIVYFVHAGDPRMVAERLPRALFHEHWQALDGIPQKELAGVCSAPPDASLIRDMTYAESIILSMMNKHFDWMTVDERKHMYYMMLGYWHAVLCRFKPDALIFATVPHSMYDYLCYELARLRGIRTILFDYTLIGDRYLWLSDFRRGSEALLSSLARTKDTLVTVAELSGDLRDYYLRSRNEHLLRVPLYVLEDKKKYSFINVLKLRGKLIFRYFRDRSLLKHILLFFLKVFGENVRREYRLVARLPDFSQPFIYVPLHYQPECTTSPQGDIFVVQTLMLEMLSAALPVGWRLYVKEHPSQWGPRGLNFSSARYRGYYRRVARIQHVTVVPVDTDSSLLIEYSKAVATVGGTAAFEALLCQKPAVIFGHPWYQNAPSILRADNVESCKQCFEKIANGVEIRETENLRFLKALEEATVHAHFQEYAVRHSLVTPEASAEEVVGTVLQVLQQPYAKGFFQE